jgi:TldD protein
LEVGKLEALERALSQDATYADIRVVERESESIVVKNGRIEVISSAKQEGFGVRVLLSGAWGFASSSKLEKKEIEKAVDFALQIARASLLVQKEKVSLSPVEIVQDVHKTGFLKDPFKVPLQDKVTLLLEADKIMSKEREVRVSRASLHFFREKKTFTSTEGSRIEQERVESGGGISATAVKEGEIQVRSYPGNFGGDFATRGYEFIESLKLAENAERVAREACLLLKAKLCPSKETTLILDGGQLALQVHESIGHPIELDRVLGTEASYAGTSFLTLDKLNNLAYGSEIVNVTADATLEGGLGTFGYDDEGVKAQRVPIIKNGLFVGYLSSRETAARLNQESNGTMRAGGWNRLPLIRMTNINLEPGDKTFEELVAGTEEGIYMETNKSWSIDNKRLNFQFGTEIAREIKDGKLGQVFKNPTYTGITPQFWNSCQAIANKDHWHIWGIPNCGKGQPGQSAHVGHGTSPAKFKNVRVGIIK